MSHNTCDLCLRETKCCTQGFLKNASHLPCDQKLAFKRECNRVIAQRREKQRLSGAARQADRVGAAVRQRDGTAFVNHGEASN